MNNYIKFLETLKSMDYPWPTHVNPKDEYNKGFSDGFTFAIKHLKKKETKGK